MSSTVAKRYFLLPLKIARAILHLPVCVSIRVLGFLECMCYVALTDSELLA